MLPGPTRRTAAQALLWMVMAVPLFMSLAGLAIDGGALLDSRRQLQSVADGAARAGATRLDMVRLRASGGSDIALDPSLATQAAQAYVDRSLLMTAHSWDATPGTEIEVGQRRVHVLLHANVQTAFLRIVFIDTVPVEATAYADLQFGIHDGSGG